MLFRFLSPGQKPSTKKNGQRSALFFILKVQRSAGRVGLRGVAGRRSQVAMRDEGDDDDDDEHEDNDDDEDDDDALCPAQR